MTPDDLCNAIDSLAAAAGDDPDQLPGLIEIASKDWCDTLHQIERTAKTLDEGIRHRGLKVVISSNFETRVRTRAEAGERGAPYRDPTPVG